MRLGAKQCCGTRKKRRGMLSSNEKNHLLSIMCRGGTVWHVTTWK